MRSSSGQDRWWIQVLRHIRNGISARIIGRTHRLLRRLHLITDIGLVAIIASMVGVIFIPVLGGIASLIVSSSRGRLNTRAWRNWQTHPIQDRTRGTSCEFNSHRPHRLSSRSTTTHADRKMCLKCPRMPDKVLALVVQLDRTDGFYPSGCGFESCRGYEVDSRSRNSIGQNEWFLTISLGVRVPPRAPVPR